MNGKELFLGLSYINRKYIEEAERDTVSASCQNGKKPIRIRKPLLIAAVIILTLLLVGCSVAVYLTLAEEPWASIPRVESKDLLREDIQTTITSVEPTGIVVHIDVNGFGEEEKSVLFLDNAPCTIEQKTADGWVLLPKETEDTQRNPVEVLTDGHHDLPIHWSAYYGFLAPGTYRVTTQVLDGHDPFTFEFEITEEMQMSNQNMIEDILSRGYWHIRETVEWVYPSLDKVPEAYRGQFENGSDQNEYWKCGEDGLYLMYGEKYIAHGMMYRDGIKYKIVHEKANINTPIVGWMPWPDMDLNRFTDWTESLVNEQYTQKLTYRTDGSVSKAVLTRTVKDQNGFDVEAVNTVTLEFLDTSREEIAQMIEDQNTNVWQNFSWAEDQKNCRALDVSFVNTTPSPIHTTADVLALAERECTVEYNQIQVYRDEAAGIWKVEYQIYYGYQGYQYVYLNDDGITVMVSGSGSKVEQWQEEFPGP